MMTTTLESILQEGIFNFDVKSELFMKIFNLKRINGKVKRRKKKQKMHPCIKKWMKDHQALMKEPTKVIRKEIKKLLEKRKMTRELLPTNQ